MKILAVSFLLYTKKAKNTAFSVSFRAIPLYEPHLARSCIPADDFAQSLYICIGLEDVLHNLLHGKTPCLFTISSVI
ncbi:hypothetical protein MITSMUL_03351 [Mitsuokella multacida DSM 20544]|uniref:Uncharacterized protein n=1 Tax=Mitsuokella multacida DSM 20544 TaxID=500635 RepID=C9KIV0_9FIRM|nr:hypothetical protein MITSMUL_03351 [Mitsuokella multacida DSM 20544]